LHNVFYPESKALEEEMKTANNDDSTLENGELTNSKKERKQRNHFH